MIQVEITNSCEPLLCTCGAHCHIIETRGRAVTSPRLIGVPARTYHAECSICGTCTAPVYSPSNVHALHRVGAVHPIEDFPTLRAQFEQALVEAAA